VNVADRSRPADQLLIDSSIDRKLRAALAGLPPLHRVVLIMREIEGLSTKEVATVTGLSEANVKARLHRARLLLRQRLEEQR
jgi:RNA polymerase sigma-70 factor (ECF subfamily)